jgi:drug/metabolite transporter (DMT)-like permease
MERRLRATVLVLGAAALWGSSFVVIKLGLEGAPPVTLSLLRFAVAAVVSLGVLRLAGPLKLRAIKDPLVVAIGLTNAAGFVFQYMGLADTNSAAASLLANLGVVVVAALSALYLHEKISSKVAAAVILTFAGGSLLATRGDLSTLGSGEFRGAVLIGIGSVIWSLFVVLNKVALERRVHTESEITWATLAITAAATLPVAVALEGVPTLAYSAVAWGAILYTAILCSSVAYVIYMVGLRELPATSTAILTVAEVLVAFVLTAIVFGTVLTGVAALGAGLVLVGILLASRLNRHEPRPGAGKAPGG